MSGPYNGWTNYETWCVKLWMDNDEGASRYWDDATREIFDDASDRDEAQYELARELKELHVDFRPELEGVYGDMLAAAFDEVNWSEIADSLLTDLET